MSTLATICLKQCDSCKQVIVLKTDLEWQSFETLWHDGFDVDFCNVCRENEEVRRLIDSDELKRQQLVEKIAELGGNTSGSECASSPSASKEKVEYAH